MFTWSNSLPLGKESRSQVVNKNDTDEQTFLILGEWDRNRSFVRIRFRRPTSAQLSRAVKVDEISVVEPTQPLRLARQSKNN